MTPDEYAELRRPLIIACKRHGITLQVVHTGGGCQNYSVDIGDDINVLLGDATEPLADAYLAPCITIGDDYADELTNDIGYRILPPEHRTIDNVARWIADVIDAVTTTTGANQ